VLLEVVAIVEVVAVKVVVGVIGVVVTEVVEFCLTLFSCLFVFLIVELDGIDECDLSPLVLVSVKIVGIIGVVTAIEFDKDNEDNEARAEEILVVVLGVDFILNEEEAVVRGKEDGEIDDTGDVEVDGWVEVEIVFVIVEDEVGRLALANFSATDLAAVVDIKLVESVNKNGNSVEGKIGGTFKFGLLFSVVDSGAIGFGTIFAFVELDDVVVIDGKDGVDAEVSSEFEILFEFKGFIIADEVGDEDFVEDIIVDGVFGDVVVAKAGVDVVGINGLVVDFFNGVEIDVDDDDKVGVNVDDFEMLDADAIDLGLINCSVTDVVGISGRESSDANVGIDENVVVKDEVESSLLNNEFCVPIADVVNDFVKAGELIGEGSVTSLLIDLEGIVLFDEFDDEVSIVENDDSKEEFVKILLISFDISFERRLILLLDDNNELVFFWIWLFIILFNTGCDFDVVNFGLPILWDGDIEEFLANEEKDNFWILEILSKSSVCSVGSLFSEIIGESIIGLSTEISDEIPSSWIELSFTGFISFNAFFWILVSFGDDINNFKKSVL